MKTTQLSISDVILLEPKIFTDDRGFFFESFNQRIFNEAINQSVHFVQSNHSRSIKNVISLALYLMWPLIFADLPLHLANRLLKY